MFRIIQKFFRSRPHNRSEPTIPNVIISPPEFSIRHAGHKDVEFMAALYDRDTRAGHYGYMGKPPRSVFSHIIGYRSIQTHSGSYKLHPLVLEKGGCPCGFSVLKWEMGVEAEGAEIWFFSIADEFTGMGVGGTLLNTLIKDLERSESRIVARCLPVSAKMSGMLKRRGFLVTKKSSGMTGTGKSVEVTWLERVANSVSDAADGTVTAPQYKAPVG